MASHLLRPASHGYWEEAGAFAELDTDPTDHFTLMKCELFGWVRSRFSPSSTHAARRSASRPIVTSRSIVVSYGIALTSSAISVPMSPSRRSRALLRNAGAIAG